METTTVEMPKEFLPVWKNFEGLNDKDRSRVIVLINNMSRKARHSSIKEAEHPSLPISPILKAAEIGEDRSIGLSSDYKKEIGERKMKRATL